MYLRYDIFPNSLATRQLGVEFLVTLAEGKPGMVRKFPKYVESVIPVILNMMLSIEDDAEWATSTTFF